MKPVAQRKRVASAVQNFHPSSIDHEAAAPNRQTLQSAGRFRKPANNKVMSQQQIELLTVRSSENPLSSFKPTQVMTGTNSSIVFQQPKQHGGSTVQMKKVSNATQIITPRLSQHSHFH